MSLFGWYIAARVAAHAAATVAAAEAATRAANEAAARANGAAARPGFGLFHSTDSKARYCAYCGRSLMLSCHLFCR